MKKSRIQDMATISMCSAFMSVAAWISIPFAVNFTLQIFVVFLICLLFDFKKSLASILMYLVLGVCGLPVFSGFGSGIGVLFGPTGGYLLGFLLIPFTMHLFLKNKNKSNKIKILAMLTALAVCYVVAVTWYYTLFCIHLELTFIKALAVCVIPFIIPDILKILLAAAVSSRLSKINLN